MVYFAEKAKEKRMERARKFVCVTSVALAGALVCVPLRAMADQSGVGKRVEKLEERTRDVEARLAKVEAMVGQHSAHAAPAPQAGKPGMQPGATGPGMGGGMMDDDMMGMPDPAPQGQGQANPPAGGSMGGGGMGGHM